MTNLEISPNFISTESAVSGIEVYMPAPVEAGKQAEVVDFKCPQCGATTAFSAAEGGLTCSHCGYHQESQKQVVGRRADEFEFTVETVRQAEQGWGLERKEMECQNCGARTSLPPESLTHTCSFCGSNKVIQRAAPQDVLRPRFLVPFIIESAQCLKVAREWLGSSWMTPASLRQVTTLANFAGIYLPFFTFDAQTTASWKAEVGHTETERYYDGKEWRERTKTVWRWESGHVQLSIDDLVVEGASHISAVLLGKIKDFNLNALVPYDPNFLAGLQAQAYDLTLEQAWETGRDLMREQTRQACLGQASTGQVRNFSMNLDFANESWRYILLPVYLSAYQFEGRVFQVMVNGQTGTIAGQRPVDWTKVWLVIAAILAPGVLLGLLGLITAPLGGLGVGIGAFGFVLLIIGLVIDVILFIQAHGLDDA